MREKKRAALAPLHHVVDASRAVILVVAHLNKGEGGDPLRRFNGSELVAALPSEDLQCRPMAGANIRDVVLSWLVRKGIQPHGRVFTEEGRDDRCVDAAVIVVLPDCVNPLTPGGKRRSVTGAPDALYGSLRSPGAAIVVRGCMPDAVVVARVQSGSTRSTSGWTA
jgi:hypothetical protein